MQNCRQEEITAPEKSKLIGLYWCDIVECPGVPEWVDSVNINSFVNCTIIDGNIIINDVTFKGYILLYTVVIYVYILPQ